MLFNSFPQLMKDSVSESLKNRGAIISLCDFRRRIALVCGVFSTMNHKPQNKQIQ